MRFLTDQDVYAITNRFLSGLGHDVVTAAQLGLAQAEDLELLRVAQIRAVSSSLVTAISVGSSSSWAVGQGLCIYAFCPRTRMLCTLKSSGS